MLISMTPNDEVKTIHASLNDGSLRKWEFEPYTENGKIELTNQDYATIQSIKGNTVKFNQLVGTSTSSLTLTNGHKYYTVIGGTKAITNGTGQSISVTGGTDMAIDLTLMGIDNLTTVEQVETWLSNNIGLLPYYDYTLGDLISFNGTGLKTENASQTENNTLSLPISTLFPTGMKEAGSVYDEISDKAYTRVGMIDLGSLNWNQHPSLTTAYYSPNLPYIPASSINFECGKYITSDEFGVVSLMPDMSISADRSVDNYLYLKDSNFVSNPSGLKQSLSGVYLYYELASPTEQDISLDLTYPIWNDGTEQILPVNGSTPTTSSMKATIDYPDRTEEVNFLYKQTTFDSAIPQFSLVCKNQELPMALNDGKLICECDSSITNESGFFDAKVKMQDLDSVAYSQKIQLHVERGIND